MQQELVRPTNGDRRKPTIGSGAFASLDQRLSSPPHLTNGADFFYPYTFFYPTEDTPSPPTPAPGSASVLLSPSSASFDGDDDDHPTATDNRLYLARLTLQYQEIRERYDLCFSHLQDAADEAEALRRENAKLRIANGELARRLALLSGKPSPRIPPPPLVDEFRRLGLGDPPAEASPTSVLGFQDPQSRAAKAAGAAEKRVVLPKSISIRSNGYLKLNQNQGCVGVGSGTNRNGRLRVPSPVRAGTVSPLS